MECVQHVLLKQINNIMLSPRLNDCPECANIPSLLKKIDCKLAELGNNLYNNISYMLNKPIPAGDINQLIGYRRILMYKLINPSYVQDYSVAMISSRVIRLTVGCVSRCNTPEPCLEVPCDITIVPNPITTTTSTSTSLTSTTTSTTVAPTTTTTTTLQECLIYNLQGVGANSAWTALLCGTNTVVGGTIGIGSTITTSCIDTSSLVLYNITIKGDTPC
jgi:hypothetical protein